MLKGIVKEATASEKQNPLGEIPLHSFCKKRQPAELEQAVTSNLYDINHKDFANWTPLVSFNKNTSVTIRLYYFFL